MECPICCDIIDPNSKFTTTPCTHKFHIKCLRKWKYTQLTQGIDSQCPVCRTVLSRAPVYRPDQDIIIVDHVVFVNYSHNTVTPEDMKMITVVISVSMLILMLILIFIHKYSITII
jgi:hypothetical protein